MNRVQFMAVLLIVSTIFLTSNNAPTLVAKIAFGICFICFLLAYEVQKRSQP